MSKHPGKIYGFGGVILMTVALVGLLTVGGVGVSLTYGRMREVGKAIKAIEADTKKLKDENRFIAEKLARTTDSISLKESVTERLQAPTADQVVVVRRLAPAAPAFLGTIPRDPRFAALDIAFIRNTPVSGNIAAR